MNARTRTADHPLDAYWTPREAVLALMRIERLPMSIADPTLGPALAIRKRYETAWHHEITAGADPVVTAAAMRITIAAGAGVHAALIRRTLT